MNHPQQTTLNQFFNPSSTPSTKRNNTEQTTTTTNTQNGQKKHKSINHALNQHQQDHTLEKYHPTTCPVCATLLENQSHHQIQLHVNRCLDQSIPITDSSRPSPITKRLHQAAEESLEIEEKQSAAPKKTKKTSRQPATNKNNPAPFYKLIPGTTISVDAFKYGKIPNVTSYFLTHAHSDHYTKLNSKWNHGPIYCSKVTGHFIRSKLNVNTTWIHPLEFDTTYNIDDVQVTLIDANHCPGSAMFLFEGISKEFPKKSFRYLHCGDFRASPRQLNHPLLKAKTIDICFLDTTYLDPQYCFPAQEQVIETTCQFIQSRIHQIYHNLNLDHKVAARLGHKKNSVNSEKSKILFQSWLSIKNQDSETRDIQDPFDSCENVDQRQKLKQVINEPMGKALEEDGEVEVELMNRRETKKVELTTIPMEQVQKGRRTLILVGTYSIGKEKIVIRLAELLKTKVFCSDPRKYSLLNTILMDTKEEDEGDDGKIRKMLSTDPFLSQIHLVNLFSLKLDYLKSYLNKYSPHFSNIIGIRPTGWSFQPKKGGTRSINNNKNPSVNVNDKSKLSDFIQEFQRQAYQPDASNSNSSTLSMAEIPPSVQLSSSSPSVHGKKFARSGPNLPLSPSVNPPIIEIYSIPYSEHSSFFELTCFCISLDWIKIIPTVNVSSPSSRAKMKSWFDRWKQERNRLLEMRETPSSASSPSSLCGSSSKNDETNQVKKTKSSLLISPRGINYW